MAGDVELARTRLAIETRLKRVDQKLAAKQSALAESRFEWEKVQAAHSGWKLFLTPTGVIIIAAAIGLIGTAVGKWADYLTTKRQQETSIVLRASEVPPGLSPEEQDQQRARNLLWFAERDFVELSPARIFEVRARAKIKPGETVPQPVVVAPQSYSDHMRAPSNSDIMHAESASEPSTEQMCGANIKWKVFPPHVFADTAGRSFDIAAVIDFYEDNFMTDTFKIPWTRLTHPAIENNTGVTSVGTAENFDVSATLTCSDTSVCAIVIANFNFRVKYGPKKNCAAQKAVYFSSQGSTLKNQGDGGGYTFMNGFSFTDVKTEKDFHPLKDVVKEVNDQITGN